MLACKPINTHMETNHKLGNFSGEKIKDVGRYQRLVGKLIYLTHTRPDITYDVSVVIQFMQNPTEDHMEAVYRILRYLKSAPGKGLSFMKNEKSVIEGYIDADWAGYLLTRKSTSGYLTFVEGNLVTWRSKKQKVVRGLVQKQNFKGWPMACVIYYGLNMF